MADRFALRWIDKNASQGPLFQLGRDVYERELAGGRLVRLKAVESYPAHVAPAAIEAFTELARTWGAPVVFIIDPNLLKPPAVRFLFEWSRSTHQSGAVERSFMKTSNAVTHVMGKVVLRVFTDGAMPFEPIQGEEALQRRLAAMDLTCPQPGFSLKVPGAGLVLSGDTPPSLLSSLLRRAARRLSRT